MSLVSHNVHLLTYNSHHLSIVFPKCFPILWAQSYFVCTAEQVVGFQNTIFAKGVLKQPWPKTIWQLIDSRDGLSCL